ncbi:MAG: cupin domain-containing protein [Desulfarculaceae bacterium]|nr:cupin domain-containing protein [Desulfarculaceae bacterium]MCF8047721.1 cupin domain-containing protein [Desulfarculaceae bacterium]MCF8065466.1 cupin domain-containing protein [Desulfarculaceae bacterium]MCF8096302.1 cupin domain-containing protein [Desulfarculaceae bacterium]MCF8123537.1 cupin domain-containing protein [Desulfarculaceae bacterium]
MEIVSLANAEHYTWGEVCDGWHLLKSGDLSVIEERVPPGGAEARHYHQHAHQFFYVLSGRATMELPEKTLIIGARQGISVPPQTPHRLLNQDKEDLVFLVMSAPPSHQDRVLVD